MTDHHGDDVEHVTIDSGISKCPHVTRQANHPQPLYGERMEGGREGGKREGLREGGRGTLT